MSTCFVSICGRRAFSQTHFIITRSSVTSAAQQRTSEQPEIKPKPFSEIPGPRSLPFVKSLWMFLPVVGFLDMRRTETFHFRLHAKYGKLIRMEVPGFAPMVTAFDPETIRQIFAIEGKYPERPGLIFLKKYRESRPDLYSNLGLFFEKGPTWKDIRSATQKHMLKTPAIRVYLQPMEKVSADFVERIKSARNDKMEVDNFLNELFKWALESVGIVALNRRLGCLDPHLTADSEPQKLIDAVQTSFQVIHNLEMGTGIDRFFPGRLYKKLVQSQDFFAAIIHKYLHQVMDEMKARGDKVEEGGMNLIETFLASKELDVKQVAVIASDMFFAGIDTTSVATGFLLYQLATNPDKQERLHQEFASLLPSKDTPITPEKLDAMVYLRACIRESMRLTPIAIGTARIPATDVVLDGYNIPAGTLMVAASVVPGMQEAYFPQAKKFLPERWLRASSQERQDAGFTSDYTPQPFATIPFGHGPRMCIGRRIAEQEMHLALIKIIQNFRVEYHHPEKIELEMSFINRPSGPLRIQFHDRK